jgi:hypothetical protein
MKLIISSFIFLSSFSVYAAQHALVIGINKYPFSEQFDDLEAAVNDAQLIAKVVRRQGIILPNHRILLDEKATRAGFDRAWQDMLRQAQPGDTLILTFAGHGSQIRDIKPFDEKDGKDESLLFYDYNEKQGFIIDDQLYSLFEKARAYKIVLLIDACHSSGMVRAVRRNTGRKRTGKYNIIPSIPVLPSNDADENNKLSHVTHITAVSSDSLVVQETSFGKQHGALSWFFAKALNGEADRNKNRYLEPQELQGFLVEKVNDKMNNQQIPKVQAGSKQVGIKLRSLFNLLKSLKPINISLREGDGIHKQGETLHFSIEPGDYEEGLKALTLFNLAGDGTLQFMYPLVEYGDSYKINKLPYKLPPLKVMPPFGSDNLVAILCRKPAYELHKLLKYNKNPTIEQVMARLEGNTCQIGQYGFFTQ